MKIKKVLKILKNTKGQSMVEFAVAAPVFILFLYSVMYLSNLYISKHNTLISARYAAWHLMRNKDANGKQLKTNISKHFFDNKDNDVNISSDTSYDVITNGDNNILAGLANGAVSVIIDPKRPQNYHVCVEYKAPIKLGALDLRETGVTGFDIKSDHYVAGNSWNGYDVNTHDIFDILLNIIKNLTKIF